MTEGAASCETGAGCPEMGPVCGEMFESQEPVRDMECFTLC